jgi:glycosyltransferase involved in cell wall biosynthesis
VGTKMLRVLHVTNDFAMNGTGITNMMRSLILGQLSRGDDITVVCGTSAAECVEEITDAGGRVVTLALPNHVAALAKAIPRFHRVLHEFRPDVIHAHTAKATAAILICGPRCQRRLVTTIHNSFQRSAALMLAARRPVCVSAAVQQEMSVYPFAGSTRHTRLIRNGATVSLGAAPPDLVSRQTVLYVGGLHERKGVGFLIRAFASVARVLPNARLAIAGRRDNPQVEALAQDLDLSDRVHFLGLLPNPAPAMAAAAVVVVPSRHEPFGLVAAEARLCGAPVIASDVGGLREVLEHGRAGILLPPEDEAAWSQAMQTLLQDGPMRSAWAERSRRDAERLGPIEMVAAYGSLYQSITAPRRSRTHSTRPRGRRRLGLAGNQSGAQREHGDPEQNA